MLLYNEPVMKATLWFWGPLGVLALLWLVGWMRGLRVSSAMYRKVGVMLLGGLGVLGLMFLLFVPLMAYFSYPASGVVFVEIPFLLLMGLAVILVGWMAFSPPFSSSSRFVRIWEGLVGLLLAWVGLTAVLVPPSMLPSRSTVPTHDSKKAKEAVRQIPPEAATLWRFRAVHASWTVLSIPERFFPGRVFQRVEPRPLEYGWCVRGDSLWELYLIYDHLPDTVDIHLEKAPKPERLVLPLGAKPREHIPMFPVFQPVPGSTGVYAVSDAYPGMLAGMERVDSLRYRWVILESQACPRGVSLFRIHLPFQVYTPEYLAEMLPHGGALR